jgi:hypothetical protein
MSERLRISARACRPPELSVQTEVDEKPAESPAVIETKMKVPQRFSNQDSIPYSSKLQPILRPRSSRVILVQDHSRGAIVFVVVTNSSRSLLAAAISRKAETQSSTTGESTASGRGYFAPAGCRETPDERLQKVQHVAGWNYSTPLIEEMFSYICF